MKIIYIFIFLHSITFSLFGQGNLDVVKNKLVNIDLSEQWIMTNDSNKVIYSFTDTMGLCQYDISPVRMDSTILHTYKLELTLEENWTEERYVKTKKKNKQLIEVVKRKILHYGDSLNWNVSKASRESVIRDPMQYIRIKPNWSESDLSIIKSITRLPNDIVNGVGIFVWTNTICLIPESKNRILEKFYNELNQTGIHTENFYYRNVNY